MKTGRSVVGYDGLDRDEVARQWGALAQLLLEAADYLFDATDLGDQSDPLHQVKISSLAIMCRSPPPMLTSSKRR
jgi:hypothetical protein